MSHRHLTPRPEPTDPDTDPRPRDRWGRFLPWDDDYDDVPEEEEDDWDDE
jgi:hypothetical protein